MSDQAQGIRRFVERTPPPRTPGGGHVVAAGKGGVGTSTVALLFAFAARRYGPVVLVDAQGGFGGPARLLGLEEPAPDDESVRHTDLGPNLVLLDTPPGLSDAERRIALRRAGRTDPGTALVVDAGARPATVAGALTDFGTSLVAVMGPDGVSPAAAYALAKLALGLRPETHVSGVANRVDAEQAGLVQHAFRSGVRRFLDRPATWLGQFPVAATLEGGGAWSALGREEPELMSAAASAATRLLRPAKNSGTSTLHLMK